MIAVASRVPGTTSVNAKRSAVPLYFGRADKRLFGWFHRPDRRTHGPVMVICPPLGYPMVMSHRGLRHLAEAAAEAGMPTLRFDYHGTGDSSGSDHEPGRVDAWIRSIDDAITEAERLTGALEVVLAGLRAGCLLAAHAASRRTDVAGLVAWAPVASGRIQVRELQAVAQLMSGYEPVSGELPEGAVMAAGFMFSRETIEDLRQLDVRRLERAPAPRVLVVPRDDLADDDRFAAAVERLGGEVTRAHHAGFAAMMRDAHATVVPEEAIRGIVEWTTRLGTTPALAVAEADPGLVLNRIPAGVGAPDGSEPSRLTTEIEEQPMLSDDGRLFGILTRPTGGARTGRPVIILASAGAVHRIGASRLYVRMARTWAERGFPVVRLDIGGIGDSLPFPGMAENDTYSARAVADIGEVAAALPDDFRSAGIVVAGICSGAHAAFHAALGLDRIVGIIMMNPIVFYWKPSDALEVSVWMSHKEVRRYQQRVTSLDSWHRVLRGKVNLVSAAQTVGIWIGNRLRAHWRTLMRGVAWRAPQRPAEEDVVGDFAKLSRRGIDTMLVFSEGEPGLSQLHAHDTEALEQLMRLPGFTYHHIAWPGHTFTNPLAQETLVDTLTRHLVRAFPPGHAWSPRHTLG